MRIEDGLGIRPLLRVGVLIAAMAAGVATLAGCGITDTSSANFDPPTPTPTPAFVATPDTPTVVNARACFDATGSTSKFVPQFGPMMRGYLAGAVRGWAHAAPADSAGTAPVDPEGTPGQPGLNLQMRWVSTNPYGDMNSLLVQVRAVPRLVKEPAAASPAFVAQDPAWQKGATLVASTAKAAAGDSAKAAQRIASFRWPHGKSGISACISALVQDLPVGHDALLVASDGEENEPPQVAGNLHHAKVLWVMPCPSGNAAHCAALQASWRGFLGKLGAESVRFIRPESASTALFAELLKGA
jgi:hypothetical protein